MSKIDTTAPAIPDDNACGEVLELVISAEGMPTATSVWVCSLDRHSHGRHQHRSPGGTAEWETRDPRAAGS